MKGFSRRSARLPPSDQEQPVKMSRAGARSVGGSTYYLPSQLSGKLNGCAKDHHQSMQDRALWLYGHWTSAGMPNHPKIRMLASLRVVSVLNVGLYYRSSKSIATM